MAEFYIELFYLKLFKIIFKKFEKYLKNFLITA